MTPPPPMFPANGYVTARAKPTATALQRRQPTASPSSGTDSATMNNGAANEIGRASCRERVCQYV